MKPLIVLDTNVFISACLGGGSANRVLRACLTGACRPLIGAALYNEYEDVLGRSQWAEKSPLSSLERTQLFHIFLAQCTWTRVYYGWRPNLPDEADNHLIELAVAGGAHHIVSRNLRDLGRGELLFPSLKRVDPVTFLQELSTWSQ